MAENLTGVWVDGQGNANDVNLKPYFRGHTWTSDEAIKLLSGESVVIELKSKKTGKPYKMSCKLAHILNHGYGNNIGGSTIGIDAQMYREGDGTMLRKYGRWYN